MRASEELFRERDGEQLRREDRVWKAASRGRKRVLSIVACGRRILSRVAVDDTLAISQQ